MDESIFEIFESIGFSKKECEVYLSLLKSGGASVGEMSKDTKLHRPNIYDLLERLSKKGVVSQTKKDGVRIFFAADPQDVLNYVKQKGYEFEKFIPQLKQLSSKEGKNERKISIAEGITPIRNVLLELLDEEETIYSYSIPKESSDIFGGVLREFHPKRISKKIVMKHIYNEDAVERVKILNKRKFTEARILPKEYDSTTNTIVCGDNVVIIFWEDPITSIKIKDISIAKTYKKYFDVLWSKSKIPK